MVFNGCLQKCRKNCCHAEGCGAWQNVWGSSCWALAACHWIRGSWLFVHQWVNFIPSQTYLPIIYNHIIYLCTAFIGGKCSFARSRHVGQPFEAKAQLKDSLFQIDSKIDGNIDGKIRLRLDMFHPGLVSTFNFLEPLATLCLTKQGFSHISRHRRSSLEETFAMPRDDRNNSNFDNQESWNEKKEKQNPFVCRIARSNYDMYGD